MTSKLKENFCIAVVCYIIWSAVFIVKSQTQDRPVKCPNIERHLW